MTILTGHYDGKVIVPDGPVDLPLNQRLVIRAHPAAIQHQRPTGTSGPEFLRAVREMKIGEQDLREMEEAIERFCERVDPDGW
jgi:hypothetical protein